MRAFKRAGAISALALVTALGCAFAVALPSTAGAQTEGNTTTTPLGLKMIDTKVGTGVRPRRARPSSSLHGLAL